MSLKSLIDLNQKTPEQIEFLDNYYRYMPVTMSNSPMNMLCRYIEGINFEISKKIKENISDDIISMLKYDVDYSDEEYEIVANEIDEYIIKHREPDNQNDDSEENDNKVVDYSEKVTDIIRIVGNVGKVINCAIDYFYINNPTKNKDIMWAMFGKSITANMKRKIDKVYFPIPDGNGDIKYLGERYSRQEVQV